MNLLRETELSGLGELSAKAPKKKALKKAMKGKSTPLSNRNATGKAMYEKMMSLLPSDIQTAIRNGRLQLVDEVLYSVKKIAGYKEKELMESGDNKEVGITNVDKQKIEANKWSLLVGIQLLSGVNADPKQAKFDICARNILEGEFELEVGNTVIVPNISCTVFDSKGRTDSLPGLWSEFDPQFIVPNTEIKPKLKMAEEAPVDQHAYFAMHVVSIAKN